MRCQNPFYFTANSNVRDVAKIPSQKEIALLNRRRGNVHRIGPGFFGNGARCDEQPR